MSIKRRIYDTIGLHEIINSPKSSDETDEAESPERIYAWTRNLEPIGLKSRGYRIKISKTFLVNILCMPQFYTVKIIFDFIICNIPMSETTVTNREAKIIPQIGRMKKNKSF